MRVTSIMLGVIGGVVLVTSLVTVLFFPLDSFMLWGKLSMGLGMVAAGLVLNWDNVKRGVNQKNTAFVISSVVASVALVGVLAAVNVLANGEKKEWDLTKDKVFTLSDQTVKLVTDLKEDVVITAFFRKDEPEGDALDDLVDRYRLHSTKLHLDLVNPETHPDKVEKYKVTEAGSRIIVEARGQEARIKEITEEALTNALIQVVQKDKKKLYVLSGHGEPTLEGDTAEGIKATVEDLKGEGYTVDALSLVDAQTIPLDAAVLLVVNPRQALLEPEAKLISDFLDHGGRVMLLVEPGVATGLEDVLARHKVKLGADTIIDATQFGRLLGQGPDTAIVAEYAEHPAMKDMEGLATIFKSARSVTEVTEGGEATANVTMLAKSNPRSWGELKIGAGDWQWDVGELRGPVPLAAAVTRATAAVEGKRSDEARLTVVGDADFANNQYRVLGGNRDFFLNLVAWTAEAEDKISIRPKSRTSSRIQLSGNEANFVAFFALDVMPVSLLSFGLAVWLVRRRR